MKLKTHKGVKKRFQLTKTGKVRYSHGGKSHLLSKKKTKKKRNLRKPAFLVGKKTRKYISQLLPYI